MAKYSPYSSLHSAVLAICETSSLPLMQRGPHALKSGMEFPALQTMRSTLQGKIILLFVIIWSDELVCEINL